MDVTLTNGALARLERAEVDIRDEREARQHSDEKLDVEKADGKDVAALAKEVEALKVTIRNVGVGIVSASIMFAFAVFELVGRT